MNFDEFEDVVENCMSFGSHGDWEGQVAIFECVDVGLIIRGQIISKARMDNITKMFESFDKVQCRSNLISGYKLTQEFCVLEKFFAVISSKLPSMVRVNAQMQLRRPFASSGPDSLKTPEHVVDNPKQEVKFHGRNQFQYRRGSICCLDERIMDHILELLGLQFASP